MEHPDYILRSSFAVVLLFVPLIISRLGFGTKRLWAEYAFAAAGFFAIFACAGWLVRAGLIVVGQIHALRVVGDFAGLSVVFAICAFIGAAFAEKTAGKMGRF
jgi:hypothetical protein